MTTDKPAPMKESVLPNVDVYVDSLKLKFLDWRTKRI